MCGDSVKRNVVGGQYIIRGQNSFSINNYEVDRAIRYGFQPYDDSLVRVFSYLSRQGTYRTFDRVGCIFHMNYVLVDLRYQDYFERVLKELDITPLYVEMPQE